jgi:hypothetical protein
MPKVEDTQKNVNICLNSCVSCMSYPDIEGEILFCSRGKSSAPVTKKGCNCSLCEMQSKYGCKGEYYCIEGTCE